ncbi:hypothetical protein CN233_04560 [Sinorhizobium meliloti]|uniref:hypothetical protein n=1 Tax=Rhizobium meliloti TaxID=382 RepID=UPI000FD7D440|nr:hypothetical protein [Sinorhizobium meliloti]RVG38009.1 hypothetical protein CN233_04560 [Sinorhizobium meliloti]
MEYLNKFLSIPVVSTAVALLLGYLFAKYQYKINFMNKIRYRNHLAKRFKTTRECLFMRRDAFFARLLFKGTLTVTYAAMLAGFLVVTSILDLLPGSNPVSQLGLVIRVAMFLLLGAVFYTHCRSLFGMATEVKVLLHPEDALSELRSAVLHNDKSAFLDETEKKTFTDILDKWQDRLARVDHGVSQSRFPMSDALAQQTPAPSADDPPAQ